MTKRLKEIIRESILHSLNEGIDFDPETKTVSYNPSHEDNVDTSVEKNPTCDGEIVPSVQVWSIFKRKRGLRGDGNPLVYALKGEGWTFRSEKDREAIEKQFDAIATKFASIYKVGVTVLMPSGNELNNHIAKIVLSKSTNGELIEGAICKLTTQEVDDIVLDFNSKFRKYYKNDFNAAYYRLATFLDEMDKKRKGTFSRHLIKDSEMRDVLDFTLKVSQDRFAEFANKINGQNILIIDDTISRGQSIKEACNIMMESYAPKSITVLTLLSKLNWNVTKTVRKINKEEIEKQLNNTMSYRMEDTEEINEYMWLKPNLTNIDVDIFVDDGGAYLRHNHELLLFARNGYGRGTANFIPFSISNKPKVLDDDMDFNISYDVIFSIQDFIQANLYALKSLADGRVSQEMFVQSII